jgi:uncharacterized protein YkwD
MIKYRVIFNGDEDNFEEFEDLDQAIYFQENRGGRLKEVEVEEEIDAPQIPSKKPKPKGEKMKKTLIATAAALTLMGCGGTGTGGDPVEYVPFDAPAISAAQKAEFLDAVNEARSHGRECGKYGYMPAVPPLRWDDRLYRAANEHSEDMAETSHYKHTGSGTEHDWTAQVLDLGRGSKPAERALNNGLKDGIGENIDAYYTTTEEHMKRWLDSEGHCRNIMYAGSKLFGMAHVENEDSEWGSYWTQTFGAE